MFGVRGFGEDTHKLLHTSTCAYPLESFVLRRKEKPISERKPRQSVRMMAPIAALVLPGSIAAVAAPAPPASTPARQIVTDTIIGAGVAGPYFLSRSGLDPYCETVTRDGDRLVAGIDYIFNPAAGNLVFDSSLRTTQTVTVRYWFNPASSHDTPSTVLSGNLDAPLLGIGSTSLHLVGDYTEGGRGHEAPPAFSTVGMILAQPLGKSGAVGAQLIFNPTPSSPAPNGKDLSVNGQYALAGLKFAARADFRGNDSGAFGSQPQGANWTVQGNLTPHLSLDVQHQVSHTGSDHDSKLTRNMDVALKPGAGVSLDLKATSIQDTTGSDASSQDESWALAGNLTDRVTLAASFNQQRKSNTHQRDHHVKIRVATVNGGAISITHADSSPGAESAATGLLDTGLDQPIGSLLHLKLDQQSQTPKGQGAGRPDSTSDRQASLQVTPVAGLMIQGGEATHEDGQGVQQTSRQLDTTVKSGSAFNLTSHFEDNWDRSSGTEHTNNLSVMANPSANLGVNIKLDSTDSRANGVAADQSVQLQVSPTSAVKVSANLSENTGGKDDDHTTLLKRSQGGSLSLDPSGALHLGAGYANTLTGGVSQQNRNLDARLAPKGPLSLSGSYVDRTSAAGDIADTTALTAAFKPNPFLNLEGIYNQNPVDSNGIPILSIQRSLALHTVIAFLDFTGKYNSLDPAGPAHAILSRQFDVGLKLSEATRLSGSYLYNGQKANPTDSLYNYKLALSRKVGDLFSLDIAGQVQADDTGLAGIQDGLKKNVSAKLGMSAHW